MPDRNASNDFLHARCGGTWQPARGWVGRYRCDRCGAFGYRRGINDCAYQGREQGWSPEMGGVMAMTREYIAEYRCATAGCTLPGVAKERKKWRCQEHREGI